MQSKRSLKEFTIVDFKGQASAITKKARRERKAKLGEEKLILSSFRDSILSVKVLPTDGGVVSVLFDAGKRQSKAKFYTVKIKFLDFSKWIPNKKKTTPQEFKDVLRVMDVKLQCNCQAFHFQGFRWKLGQLKSALYPTNIPDPHWDKYHKGGLICKHLYVVLNRFFTNSEAVLRFIKKF
jgi:hypothetical protein